MKERGNATLRWIDRALGIPLIMGLRLFKRRRALPENIRSVALLKSAGIGDVALLTGILADLKKKYSSVTLFTGQANASMGRLIPGINTIALPMTHPVEALKCIREHSCDVWIDCDPWPRISALLTYFSHSRYTIGFKTPGQFRHFLYDSSVQHRKDRHELENFRALTQPLGIEEHTPPHLEVESTARRCVVFHLFPGGSRAKWKMWPQENWISLASSLLTENYEVYFTGGKQERAALDALIQTLNHPNAHNVAGTFSLEETAKLLKSSQCVFSVDTGIMHLAAISGCQVIALHGPTSPARWGGIGASVYPLTPPLDYHPWIYLGFEKGQSKDHGCMKAIETTQVMQAWQKLSTNKVIL